MTKFLPDHPGGKKAVLLFAGKDASDEFNMLHKPEVVAKYAFSTLFPTSSTHGAGTRRNRSLAPSRAA